MQSSPLSPKLWLALLVGLILVLQARSFPADVRDRHTLDAPESHADLVIDGSRQLSTRDAFPMPGSPLGSKKTHRLRKRVDDPWVLYQSMSPQQRATTGMLRVFDLSPDSDGIFAATECYGCTVVVVASHSKLVIAHFAQERGMKQVFKDDEAFMEHVEIPLEGALESNKAALQGAPQALVFSPAVATNSAKFEFEGKVQEVQSIIRGFFSNANVKERAYNKLFSGANALSDTIAGKVVVKWVAPPGGQGRGDLFVYAESALVIHAVYTCQNGQCTLVSAI